MSETTTPIDERDRRHVICRHCGAPRSVHGAGQECAPRTFSPTPAVPERGEVETDDGPSEKAWELMRGMWNAAQDDPEGMHMVYATQALANYIAELEAARPEGEDARRMDTKRLEALYWLLFAEADGYHVFVDEATCRMSEHYIDGARRFVDEHVMARFDAKAAELEASAASTPTRSERDGE